MLTVNEATWSDSGEPVARQAPGEDVLVVHVSPAGLQVDKADILPPVYRERKPVRERRRTDILPPTMNYEDLDDEEECDCEADDEECDCDDDDDDDEE